MLFQAVLKEIVAVIIFTTDDPIDDLASYKMA